MIPSIVAIALGVAAIVISVHNIALNRGTQLFREQREPRNLFDRYAVHLFRRVTDRRPDR